MRIRWSEEKNAQLKADRNIGFEQVLAKIEAGDFLGPENNPAHPKQMRIIVSIDTYPHVVPFIVESDGSWFLKTIYPSRKQKRRIS